MGELKYIKVRLTRVTDAAGKPVYAKYKRMKSNMPSTSTLETNILWNALSFSGESAKARMWMKLDEGVLDRDILGGAEPLLLDVGILDCDIFT